MLFVVNLKSYHRYMDHAARRQTMDIIRGECPFPDMENGRDNKPFRYALLYYPISTAVENFDNSDERVAAIAGEARQISDINRIIRNDLENEVLTACASEDLTTEMEILRQLYTQKEKARRSHRLVEETLTAGVHTAVNASENLYSAIEKRYGSEIAHHPIHASIINHIARLDIDQLSAFVNTYLTQDENMLALLEDRKDGGQKLIKNWKDTAIVPSLFQREWKVLTKQDLEEKEVPLSSFSNNEDSIGCPITFEYKHVSKLWNFYAQTRHRFTMQQRLAKHSLEQP
jgi:hypothetical protein